MILEIDRADYEVAKSQAASALADAKLALQKENALLFAKRRSVTALLRLLLRLSTEFLLFFFCVF